MKLPETLTRVLEDIGNTPVRTRLTPSEVTARAHRGRRRTVALRVSTVAAMGVLVIGVAFALPTAMSGDGGEDAAHRAGDAQRQQQRAQSAPTESSPRLPYRDPTRRTDSVPAPRDTDTKTGLTEEPPGSEGRPPEPFRIEDERLTPAKEPPGSLHAGDGKPSPSTRGRAPTSPSSTPSTWGSGAESGGSRALGSEAVRLTDIRVEPHPAFDRVVFEFTGGSGPPRYEVRYLDPDATLREPGSGRPVPVEGERVLRVVFAHSTTIRGPASTSLSSPPPAVVEVRSVGGFEGRWTIGIGVSVEANASSQADGRSSPTPPGFRVRVTGDSIVVDVAHD